MVRLLLSLVLSLIRAALLGWFLGGENLGLLARDLDFLLWNALLCRLYGHLGELLRKLLLLLLLAGCFFTGRLFARCFLAGGCLLHFGLAFDAGRTLAFRSLYRVTVSMVVASSRSEAAA